MVRIATFLIVAILAHGLLLAGRAGAEPHHDTAHSEPASPVSQLFDCPGHDPGCLTVPVTDKSNPRPLQLDGDGTEVSGLRPEEQSLPSVTTETRNRPVRLTRAMLQVYRI